MKLNVTTKKGTKKGTIVLLHGNSSSSKVFTPVFESAISHSIVAFDFYGQGDSDHNGKYKLSDMKDQVISVIKSIDDEILLVGHSLGGHLAIEVANDIENLKGLLVFGTPPVKKPLNMEEAFIVSPELNTYFTENPLEHEIDISMTIAVQNKSVIPLLKQDFLRSDPKIRSVIATQFGEFSDELAILTNLACGKFIIAGDRDPSVNFNYLEQTKNEANFELIKIINCGHYPSIEQPDEFIIHLENIANQSFFNMN